MCSLHRVKFLKDTLMAIYVATKHETLYGIKGKSLFENYEKELSVLFCL
jgi:hypothetical protein